MNFNYNIIISRFDESIRGGRKISMQTMFNFSLLRFVTVDNRHLVKIRCCCLSLSSISCHFIMSTNSTLQKHLAMFIYSIMTLMIVLLEKKKSFDFYSTAFLYWLIHIIDQYTKAQFFQSFNSLQTDLYNSLYHTYINCHYLTPLYILS